MKKRRIGLLIICGAIILSTIIFTIIDKVQGTENNNTANENDKLKVVCTIFPEYDWARTIIGDNLDKVELSMIVKNGVDLHSFQPSTADVVEITSADVFIYVGGVSDNWVTDVLANSKNKNQIVVNLMDVIGDRVIINEAHEDHGHKHEAAPDEHIWLSIENAKLCVTEIAKALSDAAPNLAFGFSKNCSNYLYDLNELGNEYKNVVDNAKEKTIIVCDRFPFKYLVEDYGLTSYAAFTGCSAETEASFETIAFLSQKLQETGLSGVITIDNSDNKIANTVIQNSKIENCKIYTFDSMQSTTLDDALGGKTYISIMKENCKSLKAALN